MRRVCVVFSLIVFISMASATLSQAIWIDNGNPICLTAGAQTEPMLVPDGEGGALIIWRDLRGGDYRYYAQRIDSDGNTLLQENGVPIPTDGNNWTAHSIRPDGEGGAIIAYQGGGYIPGQGLVDYIKAARLDRNGTMMWPDSGVTLCEGPGFRWRPSVASDGAGGAIVGWDQREDYEDNWDIYIQHIDANGTIRWGENGVPVCTAPHGQFYVRVSADGAGGAFVTWQDSRDDDNHVFVEHVDADGNMLWDPDGRPITTPSSYIRQAVVLADNEGGAFVNWVESAPDGRYLYSQRIDVNGDPLWDAAGVPVCESPGNKCTCWNLSDQQGGFFIVWRDMRSDDWDIYAQRVDRNGTMLWQQNGVPVCTAPGWQYEFIAVADGLGGVYAVWEDRRFGDDNYDIYAQRIDADGSPRWMENGIALCDNDSMQTMPAVTTDMKGGAYVAWVDYRYRTTDRQERDIFATRIVAEEVMAVAFDIKPGSCSNPLNPKSKGVLPAAILGTAEFDVSAIDPASVRLEGVAPVRWSMEDVGTPAWPKDGCDCTELDGDGYNDLMLKFETQELVGALGPLTTGGELVLTVTGELIDGTPFEGRDCVVLRGGRKYEEWLASKRGLACESGSAAVVQRISYELPERALVEVSVYDVSGRLVERLVREVREAGAHTIEWNTEGVQSGIYFVRIRAGSWNSTMKVPLVR